MRQFYSRFRVMLLTFTFGLAVVPFSNALYEKWSEISVDLPVVESDTPVIVMVPTERRPFRMDSGGGSGRDLDFASDANGKKAKDIPTKASLKDCLFRNRKP